MKKRILAKILRELYWVSTCFCAGYLIRNIILGKTSTIQIIVCIVFCLTIIWNIVKSIRMECCAAETFKYFNLSLIILQSMHNERYRCYLSGNVEKATEYTKRIQDLCTKINDCAEECLLVYSSKKKKIEKILKIMEKIEQINTTITPIQSKQNL